MISLHRRGLAKVNEVFYNLIRALKRSSPSKACDQTQDAEADPHCCHVPDLSGAASTTKIGTVAM